MMIYSKNDFEILNVKLSDINRIELAKSIKYIIQNNEKHMILNINVNAVNIAQSDPNFLRIINSAKIVFCDGFGIKLGLRILGKKVRDIITYDDWIYELSELCENEKFSIFILGGRDKDLLKAKNKLKGLFPKLNIVGYQHGYYAKDEEKIIMDKINDLSPNIILVSMGMPKQEFIIDKYFNILNANIFLSAGGCIDLLSGRAKQPPKIFVNLGLRWLFRFTYEPFRVFKRYIFGNPLFLFRVFTTKFK